MARKVKTVTIEAEGRDTGKVFVLTEMPASQAEKWAIRALLALGRSGIDIPPGIAEAGMAGVAAIGVRALLGLQFYEAEPLLDEAFRSCVGFYPDPRQRKVIRGKAPPGETAVGDLIEDDIEEVATRARLRSEVFELHTGFSAAGLLSAWAVPAVTAENMPTISTSPEASE